MLRRSPALGSSLGSCCLASLALVLLLAGCRPQIPPGGTAFSRVESAHFTVYSDLPAHEIERQTRRLEQLMSAFLQYGWEMRGEPPLHVNVVMLSDPEQLRELADDKLSGYMFSPVLFEPWLVVPGPRAAYDLQVVSHELTHSLAFQVVPHQPSWFAEGVAGYFETTVLSEKELKLGNVPVAMITAVAQEGLLPSADLFDEHSDHLTARFYGTSWFLVHYLMSERADEFVAYQALLAGGKSHQEAWASAFPKLQGTALDKQLAAYLEEGTFSYFSFPPPVVTVQTRTRPLLRADEEALWAILWSSAFGGGAEAKSKVAAHLKRALALDPHQLQALALAAETQPDPEAGLRMAQQLAEKHPDSWLAWLTLAKLLDRAERPDSAQPSAAERALALVPRQPYALMLRAFALARVGRRTEALSHAAHALQLQPGNDALLWSRASLLAALGDCSPLVDVTRSIRQVGHTSLTAKQRASLEELSAICRKNLPE